MALGGGFFFFFFFLEGKGDFFYLIFFGGEGGLFCYHFLFLSSFLGGVGSRGGGSLLLQKLSVFAHIKKGKSGGRYCIFSVYKYSFQYRGKTK